MLGIEGQRDQNPSFSLDQCIELGGNMEGCPPRTWEKVVPKVPCWQVDVSCKRLVIRLIQETVEM